MMLVPRHDFEAASSIQRGLHMDVRDVLRPGEELFPGLAYGSISGPLDALASETRYVYGTGKDLLRQRTSGWYQALGLFSEGSVRLQHRLLTGEGRACQSQLAVWAAVQRCGVRVCPPCEHEIWKEFGVSAFLWPHLIPFVEACPWHGVLLLERCPLSTRPIHQASCKAAHPDQIALSKSLLALHALHERQAISHVCRSAMEQAGFLYSNGRYRAREFADAFSAFARVLAVHPTLRHLAIFPLRSREILRWIAGNGTLNPAFVLLMWLFVQQLGQRDREARHSCTESPSGALMNSMRAWRAKKTRQSPVDVRTHYSLADAESLFAAGSTCGDVARLCRVSIHKVYRYVAKNGLRHLIESAQRNRLTTEARETWLRRMRQFPAASANRLAKLEPRAYRWLYRNDNAWLRRNWPLAPARKHRKRADSTAPHGQDAAMCARIRAARKALRLDALHDQPSLAALCRQLGVTEYGLRRCRRWKRVDNEVKRCLSAKTW